MCYVSPAAAAAAAAAAGSLVTSVSADKIANQHNAK